MGYKVKQEISEENKKIKVDVNIEVYKIVLEDDNKSLKDILFDIKNNDEILLKDSNNNVERYKQCFLGDYGIEQYIILMNIKKNELVYFNIMKDNLDLVKCDDAVINDKLLNEYNSLNSKENKKVFNELLTKKIDLILAFDEYNTTYITYNTILSNKILDAKIAHNVARVEYLSTKKDFYNKLLSFTSSLVRLYKTVDEVIKLDEALKLIKSQQLSLFKDLKKIQKK